MARFRRVAVLLLVAMMTTSMIPAVAQDEAVGPLDDLTQLDGIEAAVGRSYSIEDLFAIFAATPEEGVADPLAEFDGPLFVIMQVLKFDSSDNAEAAFNLVKDEGGASFAASIEDAETEVSEDEIDDLGDRAFGIDLHSTAEGEEGYYRVAFAQDDEFVFVVITVAVSEGGIEHNDDLLDYMVNDGEQSDDDEEFLEAGGSTGGLWEIFPDEDHEAFEGLIPIGDEILFPIPDDQ